MLAMVTDKVISPLDLNCPSYIGGTLQIITGQRTGIRGNILDLTASESMLSVRFSSVEKRSPESNGWAPTDSPMDLDLACTSIPAPNSKGAITVNYGNSRAWRLTRPANALHT